MEYAFTYLHNLSFPSTVFLVFSVEVLHLCPRYSPTFELLQMAFVMFKFKFCNDLFHLAHFAPILSLNY